MWDGSGWKVFRAQYAAASRSTGWSYGFDPPGGGVTVLPYRMTSQAFDGAGNPSLGDARYFSISQVCDRARVNGQTGRSVPLLVGDGINGGYVGGIDEVAVYSTVLTPVEVMERYSSMAAGDDAAYGVLVSGDTPVS